MLKKPRRVADIAFPGRKIAIFVDGCFWHGCPEHASWPRQNARFWREKIERNRWRDSDTNERLRALGWRVVRVWEHEPVESVARQINDLIQIERSRDHQK